MVEESEFKNIISQYDQQRCHFNKAILHGCAGCSRSQRVLVAEREALSCQSRVGHLRCAEVLALLREKSLFALGMTQPNVPLPHGKEMKVECGGLQALAVLASSQDIREIPPDIQDIAPDIQEIAPDVQDIDTMLQVVIRRYGSLSDIPMTEVVRSVSRYSLRKRSNR